MQEYWEYFFYITGVAKLCGSSNLCMRLFELCENLNISFLYLLQSVEIL